MTRLVAGAFTPTAETTGGMCQKRSVSRLLSLWGMDQSISTKRVPGTSLAPAEGVLQWAWVKKGWLGGKV